MIRTSPSFVEGLSLSLSLERERERERLCLHDTDQSVLRGGGAWPILDHTGGVVSVVGLDITAIQPCRRPHERALLRLIRCGLSLH
jgi:hypothetical protein